MYRYRAVTSGFKNGYYVIMVMFQYIYTYIQIYPDAHDSISISVWEYIKIHTRDLQRATIEMCGTRVMHKSS